MRFLALLGAAALLAGCSGGTSRLVPPSANGTASSPAGSQQHHARSPRSASVTALSGTVWITTGSTIRAYPSSASGAATPTATISGFMQPDGPSDPLFPSGSDDSIVVGPDGTVYQTTNYLTQSSGGQRYYLDAFGPGETSTPWQEFETYGTSEGVALVDDGIDVAWHNFGDPCAHIDTYDYAATGNPAPAPIRSLCVKRNPYFITADGNDDIFTADPYTGIVAVYPPYASGSASQARLLTVAPKRTSAFDGVNGLAVDEGGTLYVVVQDPSQTTARVDVYAPGTSGTSPAPMRSITGITAYNPKIALAGDGTLYVSDANSGHVYAYAAGASGNAAPLRTLAAAKSGEFIQSLAMGP